MKGKRITVIVALLASAGGAYAQSVGRVAIWAETLYGIALWEHDGTIDIDPHVHRAALSFVHRTSKEALGKMLRRVVVVYGFRSPQGVSATYLMAMHQIDLDMSLLRLESLTRMTPLVDPTYKKGNEFGPAGDAMEELPSALKDIAVRLNSKRVVTDLMILDTDGGMAESQAGEITDLLEKKPRLVIATVAGNQNLTESLYGSLGFSADGDMKETLKIRRVGKTELKRQTSPDAKQICRVLADFQPHKYTG
ncbi:MAG TPA: hypothetical protein VGL56_19795 [Fimbriimonadaceae bacterium]